MPEILVAIDGSKYSLKIVDYACDLAKKMSATIALLYVTPKLIMPDEYSDFARMERLPDAYAQYVQAVGEDVLSTFGKKISSKGISYEGLIRTGNVSREIERAAEARNSTLIVVGLRGLHGLGRVRALGSVARRVMENSSRPVLVVPA